MQIVVVPAIITLAVTLLRLFGELQHWSPNLFNPVAGGGGALIGISWLVPVFGIYFALRLAAQGERPASLGRAIGFPFGAFAAMFALGGAVTALRPGSAVALTVFAAASWGAIVFALKGWPALGRMLLAYAFAARIPVALVMLVAIMGEWGTHYDAPPPNAPDVLQMGPLTKWFWIGLVPQMTIWIFFTVIVGMFLGSIAVKLFGRKAPAPAAA
jgi:hypothetical protein